MAYPGYSMEGLVGTIHPPFNSAGRVADASRQVVELLQVMSLVQVFVRLLLKARLKVAEGLPLLSPLTRPQTTTP